MIETLFYTYLVLGLINSLVIWWSAFNKDFDKWFEMEYNEDPPSTKEKYLVVVFGVILWPYHLYKYIRG